MKRAALAVLLLASPASADVDWEKGLVTADGVGVADRHAPNPAVARGTSRRGAEDAAKKQLAEAVAALPLAAGGKVGDKAKDKAVAARLAAAVDHALTVTAEPETDGAWRVTLAVPVEAVRQAIAGAPRTLPAGGDKDPPLTILDGVGGKPAVGALDAATVWVKDVPAWAKDAPHAAGTRGKDGRIEGITASPATLYVIVTK